MFITLFAQSACGLPDTEKVPEATDSLAEPDTPQAEPQSIVLAGGCFWCVEAVFAEVKGVSHAVSGYAGDTKETANYEAVSSGQTDHAEVVKIDFDPTLITRGEILKLFFTYAHDPTQLNRQGPDAGRQYRSAVFYKDDEEKTAVAEYIKRLDESGAFPKPVVTTLEPLTVFYPAESYHQDFAEKNPNHGYIRQQSTPKVEKIRKGEPEKVKD